LAAPIDFYFDFSSPYGYIASKLVDGIAAKHGRQVTWRPMLLGPVFKVVGTQPLVEQPLKGDYSRHDFPRTARFHGVPFTLPSKFPVGTVAAGRAFYWLHDRDPALAKKFAQAVFAAFYGEGRDVSDPAVALAIAQECGADRAALEAALADPAVKERLKTEVDAAIARGVFGSPYFFVDGEPFWGVDRLPMLDAWLARGGW
jgi:2-hydroxychromene-2-carboxylate isomerase